MDADNTVAALRRYVSDELLDGEDVGLDGKTPLLKLGVINSMSLVKLTAFITEEFGVVVPVEDRKPDNWVTLEHIASLIARLKGK